MKKVILGVCFAMLLQTQAFAYNVSFSPAFTFEDESSLTMDNIWDRNGKYEEKVLSVAGRLLEANKFNRRVAFRVIHKNIINASTDPRDKVVTVHKGLFPYIDNDDELAFVLGHEAAHAMDAYGGSLKWLSMNFNSKHYEYKADLMAIDYMVKAGYNPVSAIIVSNKFMDEIQYEFGFWVTHPKTSKRLMAMYKYISLKYPGYLKTAKTENAYFKIFKYNCAKEIAAFEQSQRERKNRNEVSNI